MYPILYNSETLIIESYSFFFMLAMIVGFVVFYIDFKSRNWDVERMMMVLSGCVIGMVVGSTLFNLFLFDTYELIDKIRNLNFDGMSVIGGISGGFIGVEIIKKIIGHKEPTGDAFALAIPLGHIIGRLGCLLGGCCYGTICNFPWGVSYPKNSLAFMHHVHDGFIAYESAFSLPVHPTPIYEILFNIIIFLILFKLRTKIHTVGALFRFYIVFYATFRFFEEFVRADTGATLLYGLKFVQFNLLCVIIYFAYWIYKNEFKSKKTLT